MHIEYNFVVEDIKKWLADEAESCSIDSCRASKLSEVLSILHSILNLIK